MIPKSTIHILNQYIWPDGSPVCIYAEQLAEKLYESGIKVVMVGGSGIYRNVSRPKPDFPLYQLQIPTFPRQNIIDILREYRYVAASLQNYIKDKIKPNDVVIATSSPFLNVFMVLFLIRKNVKKIYWLSDYFPDSLISINKSWSIVKPFIDGIWKVFLNKWDVVIRISDNMRYRGENAVLFRLWPTLKGLKKSNKKPKKWVLYSGNLGITHDEKALISKAFEYFQKGYEIHFYVDGPKAKLLPEWIQVNPILRNEQDYLDALEDHEVHLIAGTANNAEGSFPSKIWNSIAIGRTTEPCGFVGAMNKELLDIQKSDYHKHLFDLANFIRTQLPSI